MARSKTLLLVLVFGIFLSACGENSLTNTPVAFESNANPGLTINGILTSKVTVITTPTPVKTQPVNTTVVAMTASPTTPFTTRIVDTTAPPPSPVIGSVYLAETTDGGLYWSALITQTNPLKVEYSGFDKLPCLVTKTCAHIKSIEGVNYPYFDLVKDGLKNWKPFFTLNSTDITCINPAACWRLFYNLGTNDVAFTKDQGASWTRLTRNENLRVNDANKEIYLKARRNSEITSELAFTRTISCTNISKCLIIGGGGRSVRTIDAGKTWDWFFTEPAFYIDSVCPDESVCYALARDGISLSTNFGETWQKLKTPKDLYQYKSFSCLSQNDCVVLGSESTIYSTNDMGSNWKVNTTPSRGRLLDVSCPGDNSCYVITSDRELLVTKDAGKSWILRPINLNIPFNFYGKVSCPASNNCLITFNASY